MAYKTTATTDFNLSLNDIVEEAFERVGSELRSGYDMRTARRSLNLLTMDGIITMAYCSASKVKQYTPTSKI
jgi:hypothetical protein